MKIQLLSSALLAAPVSALRIINGREAKPGEFPYAVSFWGSCGGSMIASDVILTAAHCIEAIEEAGSAIIGTQHLLEGLNNTEGQLISVKKTLSHELYDPEVSMEHDILLAFLEEPADQSVGLVKLNGDASYPGTGSPISVAGWGNTKIHYEAELSMQLMAVDVSTVSNEDCDNSEGVYWKWVSDLNRSIPLTGSYKGKIKSGMLCAQDLDGDSINEESCQGDSGGPLVVEGSEASADVQVGVVSWGLGCADEDFPGVYARVSTYYNWIKKRVCEGSEYAPEEFECGNYANGATMTDKAKLRVNKMF